MQNKKGWDQQCVNCDVVGSYVLVYVFDVRSDSGWNIENHFESTNQSAPVGIPAPYGSSVIIIRTLVF